MLLASADFIAYEALTIGAQPAVRAVFLPYIWPNGVNADGNFVECSFISTDRIQADFHGFTGGYWISEALISNLQEPTSPAVITWDWNSPGYDLAVFYRSANDITAFAAAAWTAIESGDTIIIYPYYQFKITIEGVRAWVEESLATTNDFSTWAEDTIFASVYQGYAEDQNVSGDLLTYVKDIEPLGEFAIVRDIEQVGSVSMEAPTAFDDLVAGSHSGLLLNNRQFSDEVTVIVPGEEIQYVKTPTPLFSPDKSSFFLAGQDWYNLQLKIQLGWSKGGWFTSEWGEDEWMADNFTEFITLFHGLVKQWGPVTRAVGSPNNVEVYAEDFISDCLKKRIALPAADGTPNPLILGEFLCEGQAVSGWSPAPIARSAYFEENNFNELDHIVAAGGGVISLITPGLTGNRAVRCEVTGASQSAYGELSLGSAGEIFVTGTFRVVVAPTTPTSANTTILSIVDATGVSAYFYVYVDETGAIYTNAGGQCDFNILAYLDVPLTFAMWYSPVTTGRAVLWINGDVVMNYSADFSAASPMKFRIGAVTSAVSESWTVDFDDLEIRSKYYHNAYQVYGGPFESIGPIYIDNLAQPASKTVEGGAYTQTLTRYPEYGMVQFESTDPDFDPDGDVLIRVVEHAGGRHALDHLGVIILNGLSELASFSVFDDMVDEWLTCTKSLAGIQAFLATYGLTDYIDADVLSDAYIAAPDDIIHSRFEGGSLEKRGLKDIANLGISASDAIKEICSRMMYWFFMDSGKIKIIPYAGTPPVGPVLALTASNKWENSQTIDLTEVNAFVSVVYGWYARNPSLFYLAGIQEAGGQGTSLSCTWDDMVCCEIRDVMSAKAELLLKFLSAKDIIEPVSMSLAGARLELMTDTVSLRDELLNDEAQNYQVRTKEVNLDQGSRDTALTLVRFLGET
jgi:hypothetical protein